MLQRFLILICCSLSLGCDETIDARQLEIDNGLYYKKGDNEPFNGRVENFYPHPGSGIAFSELRPQGIERCAVHFKKGTLHGNAECFSGDEKIAVVGVKDGIKHGREAVWDKTSGALLYDANFERGVKDGLQLTYDQSGKHVVRKAYYSKGTLMSSEQWNSARELHLKLNFSASGTTGFSVDNSGTAIFYDAEKGIIVTKHFKFKSNYEAPRWSGEMRYFGDMEGAYLRNVTVAPQEKGHLNKSYDYFNENGSPESNETLQYQTKHGLDVEYIQNLHPRLFQ